MRPAIFTGSVQQGGSSASDPIAVSATGVGGEKYFQLLDSGGTPFFHAFVDQGSSTYGAANTVETTLNRNVVVASRNNTDTVASVPHMNGGTNSWQSRMERYDNTNLSEGVYALGFQVNTTWSGTYTFGDIDFVVGGNNISQYLEIKYLGVTKCLIQWGYGSSGDSTIWTYPRSGITPNYIVGVPFTTNTQAVTLNETSIGSSSAAGNFYLINNNFPPSFGSPAFSPNSFFASIWATADSFSHEGLTITTSTGSVVIAQDGVELFRMGGYSYGGSNLRVTRTLSIPMFSNPFAIAGWCTGTVGRNLVTYDPINTSQMYVRTYQWASGSSQPSMGIAMDVNVA